MGLTICQLGYLSQVDFDRIYKGAAEGLPAHQATTHSAAVPRRISIDLVPEGSRVLDLGCGTGHDATALARQGFQVTAAGAQSCCWAV